MPGNTQALDAKLRLAVCRQFREEFKRSSKGNLWRPYAGKIISVFKRADGDGFAWCIATEGGGARFSPDEDIFETEDDALWSLFQEMKGE